MIEIIILALVGVGVFFAVRSIRRRGLSCGGDCSACGIHCKKRDKRDT